MSIFDNIEELLKESGKSRKELCTYIGVEDWTHTGWKAGRTKSYMRHLTMIADFLNVTVDEIVNRRRQTIDETLASIFGFPKDQKE